MILPIVAYGAKVLKKKAQVVDLQDPNLPAFIADMWETMYAASGVGLAAPQVGKPQRIFVIDAAPFADDESHDPSEQKVLADFKKVFINPTILSETGATWPFNEGCLSIPNVREEVLRRSEIRIEYQDENFKKHIESFDGLIARVIQHEYDHIEGVLFTFSFVFVLIAEASCKSSKRFRVSRVFALRKVRALKK